LADPQAVVLRLGLYIVRQRRGTGEEIRYGDPSGSCAHRGPEKLAARNVTLAQNGVSQKDREGRGKTHCEGGQTNSYRKPLKGKRQGFAGGGSVLALYCSI
jgi:hypothetical protein